MIRVYTIATIFTLFVMLVTGCKEDSGVKYETYMVARDFSEDSLGPLLREYFSKKEKSAEFVKKDFVQYAVKGELFADFPPPKSYESREDLSFYLVWPESLNSRNPQLVAYTQPFDRPDDKKRKYRCLLFFRQNEPIAVIIEDSYARELIGFEALDNNGPDLYLWPDYQDYMKDQRRQ